MKFIRISEWFSWVAMQVLLSSLRMYRLNLYFLLKCKTPQARGIFRAFGADPNLRRPSIPPNAPFIHHQALHCRMPFWEHSPDFYLTVSDKHPSLPTCCLHSAGFWPPSSSQGLNVRYACTNNLMGTLVETNEVQNILVGWSINVPLSPGTHRNN